MRCGALSDHLIANARQYGRRVWLSSVPAEEGIDILVDDDGPGIPSGERERVFQPFVRLDASRNPSTGGVGLGLTIARATSRAVTAATYGSRPPLWRLARPRSPAAVGAEPQTTKGRPEGRLLQENRTDQRAVY